MPAASEETTNRGPKALVVVVVLTMIAGSFGMVLAATIILGGMQQTATARAYCQNPLQQGQQVGDVPPVEDLNEQQTRNAATIVGVAERLGVGEYGQVVAIAAAWQESTLRNVDHGDRDSLGLFQQRPSTGWGSRAQITNPSAATRAFFGRVSHTSNPGLLDLSGWQSMPVGKAAQRVQRSADPTGSWYAEHELFARRVVASLHRSGGSAGNSGVELAAADASPQQSSGPAATKVRVVQANINHGLSPRQVRGDIARVVQREPDLVALQEVQNRSRQAITPAGYDLWRPDGGRGRGDAVLWRSDQWERVDQGRLTLVERGPQKWDAGRGATWVTLQATDSNRRVSLVSLHHMINPAKFGPRKSRRQQLYRQSMIKLARLADRLPGPTLIAGDFNAQYHANNSWGPRPMLGQHGLKPTMAARGAKPTHDGGGIIDYLFYPSTQATVSRQWIANLASDHKLLGADIRLGAGTGAVGLMCGTGQAMECPATPWPELEAGLTPDGLRTLRCVHQQFPRLESFGGRGDRPSNPDSSHATGRAVDAMIPDYTSQQGRALGTEVARWVRQNAQQLGVKYVIWNDRIWSAARSDEGWRPYQHPSGATDDTSAHRDHVHIDVHGNAAGGGGGGGGSWATPVQAGYTLTAEYGECSAHWESCHTGLDFAAPTGTPIVAASAGTVAEVGAGGPYGRLTKIDHGNGVETWYAHQSSTSVQVGDRIRAGQRIGTVGATGNTTGPHLHLEVRTQGSPTDPAAFLADRGVSA